MVRIVHRRAQSSGRFVGTILIPSWQLIFCEELSTPFFALAQVFAYAWVGSLVVPLILGVVLAAKGSCLLRDRGVRPPKSQRNIDVQKVDRSELTFHFDQELFMNLWANVRYYPYMLLFLSVVYIVCGLTAAKVGAGKSPHVYTDAESRDALVSTVLEDPAYGGPHG